MSIKPILFNTEMVRAILEGRKTKTRRLLKFQPEYGEEIRMRKNKEGKLAAWFYCEKPMLNAIIPSPWCGPEQEAPYQPGDVLWVRETWNGVKTGNPKIGYKTAYWYKADDKSENPDDLWRPSIHMPKEAARIFLRVTNVQAKRLHDMTDRDAKEEGIGTLYLEDVGFGDKDYGCMKYLAGKGGYVGLQVEQFAHLWDSTIKKPDIPRFGWEANPWVWVYEFVRVESGEQ